MPSILDANLPHGYFLGLRVPPAVQPLMMAIAGRARQELRLHGPLRPRELLHVTLVYLGAFDGPDEQVDRLLQLVRAACDDFAHPTFEIGFDTLMAFGAGGRRKPVVAIGTEGVRKVIAFQTALCRLLQASGLAVPRANFNPHVTLLYTEDEMRSWAFDPVCWPVLEFQLIHSNIGQSRYDVIDRWVLRDDRGLAGVPTAALPEASPSFPRKLAASNGARTLMSLSK